jgi:hypothetical protein
MKINGLFSDSNGGRGEVLETGSVPREGMIRRVKRLKTLDLLKDSKDD